MTPTSAPWRTARVAGVIICIAAPAAPLLLALAYGAEFLDLANESLAYRFFFCVRVAAGEPVVVGVGYLLAALQQGIYTIIALIEPDATSFRWQIQAFAVATNAILAFAMTAVLFCSFIDPVLREADRWLVAMVALVPIWGTRITGFYYAVMADYLLLNLILTTAACWVFLREWRRDDNPRRFHSLVLGFGMGVLMANKPTLAVIGAPALIPTLMSQPFSLASVSRRCLAAGIGLVSGLLAVIAASYRFDLNMLVSVFPVWLSFVRNPGGESQFWTTFGALLFTHGYALCLIFFLLGVGSFLRAAGIRTLSRRETMLLVVLLLGGALSSWFVLKRPAGTTLFESAAFLLALGAMAMATARRRVSWILPATGACWVVLTFATFDWREALETVRLSRTRAMVKWQHYVDVRTLAAGRPIVIVFPNNSYHHEGVAELLLKGAVEFPTWRISEGGRRTLATYAPRLSFRHTLGGATNPDAPYEGGTVLVWYVSRVADPTLEYSTLADAINRCAEPPLRWTLEGSLTPFAGSYNGQARRGIVVAHACTLRDHPV